MSAPPLFHTSPPANPLAGATPVPGDPGAVLAQARLFGAAGGRLDDTASQVTSSGGDALDGWSGPASGAFGQANSLYSSHVGLAGQAMRDVGSELLVYGNALQDCRTCQQTAISGAAAAASQFRSDMSPLEVAGLQYRIDQHVQDFNRAQDTFTTAAGTAASRLNALGGRAFTVVEPGGIPGLIETIPEDPLGPLIETIPGEALGPLIETIPGDPLGPFIETIPGEQQGPLIETIPEGERGPNTVYSDGGDGEGGDSGQPTTPEGEKAKERVEDLQGRLPEGSKGRVTIAVGIGVDAEGNEHTVIGTSEDYGHLRPSVREGLQPGDEVAKGQGHAEESVIEYMREHGLTPVAVAAGRPMCDNCVDVVDEAGAHRATPPKHPR